MARRSTVVAAPDQRRLLDDVLSATGSGAPCVVVDAAWPDGVRRAATQALDAAERAGRVAPGDLVVFTSGSTSTPRGVVRTVASWQASAGPLTQLLGLARRDRVWLPGSLSSSLFLYGAWHAAVSGSPAVLRDEDPTAASVVHCVPAQVPRIVDLRRDGGLPRLRVAVVAGDRLPSPARAGLEAAGVRVVEYYGAAELSFVACRDAPGPMRPFPGVEVALRAGVLWARSPYLARGYLREDDAGPLARDADGWATVGDLASGEPRSLLVRGRGDAAVTTGGHTVLVEDVEDALRGVPGVADVAVLGRPDARLGQVVVAVVAGHATTADLRAAARALPPPSRPRRWVRVDRLPRTASGKLRRADVADLVTTLDAT